jgi:apolipoprotein N-acyltransferase
VAYVQGGGPRGLRAVDNDFTDVYGNQVDATARVKTPVDLVVWPEDVIDIPDPIETSPLRDEVGALATKLDATLVAGVVEDYKTDKFKNAAVAWDRSGKITDRYDKVHRVPFGEYVPWRGLISKLADLSAVPRDAFPGTGPGLLLTRRAELGVVISYEVFFSDRARAAIRAGGELLLVPTNASSFKGRQVPAQEVAAAQLRAVETGRDTVQAAPTGHSAFVDANGNVSHRSKLGAAAVAQTTLQRRTGQTPFNRWGDRPMIALVLLTLVLATVLDRSVKENN